MSKKTYRVFLSAAEPSADIHCANLIKAIRSKTSADIEFVGIGGPKMAEAGCQVLENPTAQAKMLLGAVTEVWRFWKLLRRIKYYFKTTCVDLTVVCDSPSFNFHVAKLAKKQNIQTLFYVAPQLWAWAPGRIKKLRKRCDRLACILPFEYDYFTQRGVNTTFVGNPLFDNLPEPIPRPAKSYKKYDVSSPEIALVPGSRNAEINSLWQPMQQVAMELKKRFPGAKFTAVPVDEQRHKILQDKQLEGFSCEYKIWSVFQTAAEVDFCLVTSGSATLQVAGAACPMVIMYQSNRFLWHLLGKFIVKTKYLSLVNILSDRELVPEFMPYFRDIEPIIEAATGMLGRPDRMAKLSEELYELTLPLSQNASQNTGDIVLEMIGRTEQK